MTKHLQCNLIPQIRFCPDQRLDQFGLVGIPLDVPALQRLDPRCRVRPKASLLDRPS
jgi:hypothetical protein